MSIYVHIFSAVVGLDCLLAPPGIQRASAQLGRGMSAIPAAPPLIRPMSRADRAVLRVDRATAFEERIEQAVEEIVSIDFRDARLDDAIAQLSARHNVPMLLDQKGLVDAAVDPSAPVTCSIRGLSLRTALDLMLDEFDLTWTIQDQVLKITSKEKADEILTTKIYPVGDLLGTPRSWGPIMNIMTTIIQPDSWEDNGGPGSIQPLPTGDLLIICQKSDVHEQIEDLLVKIRRETGTAPRAVPRQFIPATRVGHRPLIAQRSSHNFYGGATGNYDKTTRHDPDVNYTANRDGLQIVSGLYGGTCRVQSEVERQSPERPALQNVPAGAAF